MEQTGGLNRRARADTAPVPNSLQRSQQVLARHRPPLASADRYATRQRVVDGPWSHPAHLADPPATLTLPAFYKL